MSVVIKPGDVIEVQGQSFTVISTAVIGDEVIVKGYVKVSE